MKYLKKRYFFALMVFSFLGFTIKDEETKTMAMPANLIVDVPQLATAIPEENNSETDIIYSSLHAGKTFVGFKEALAYRESRGSYTVVNRFGYMGKYQFGKRLLHFFGVNDTDAFLSSPQLQEQVFILSLQRSKWFLRKEIERFAGKKINGIPITESGILAAAHLAGAPSVRKFFKNKGNYNFADGNGITLQNYLKAFAGYDTSHIIAQESPTISDYIERTTNDTDGIDSIDSTDNTTIANLNF